MLFRVLRYFAAFCVLIFVGAAGMRAQSAAEYGMMTGNSAAAGASARPLIPMPNFNIPGGSSSAGAASGPAGVPGGTAESAAKTNLQFFQSHSGPDAATVAVHTTPDHASAWIDGKFVGPAPLDLKLAPGHHRVLVRAPNMQQSLREFDVTAKQPQSVEVALKSAYQNQVAIHWPAQK